MGLVAIALVNLIGVTIVLLFLPGPHPFGVIGILWAIAVAGLGLLARHWRKIAPSRPSPSRAPPARR
jgi:4-hydroxybenzoate polyprenyltransferase